MISDFDVFKALRGFIRGLFPDVEVIRTQVNDVPMPKGAFVTMNDIGRNRLATNIRVNHDTGESESSTQDVIMKTEHMIQVDFYGPGSSMRAQTFATLFRDYYAYDNFPENIKPLFCTDPVQMQLITGEEAYMERWRCNAHIHLNPVVTIPMEYFDEAAIIAIVNADQIEEGS